MILRTCLLNLMIIHINIFYRNSSLFRGCRLFLGYNGRCGILIFNNSNLLSIYLKKLAVIWTSEVSNDFPTHFISFPTRPIISFRPTITHVSLNIIFFSKFYMVLLIFKIALILFQFSISYEILK